LTRAPQSRVSLGSFVGDENNPLYFTRFPANDKDGVAAIFPNRAPFFGRRTRSFLLFFSERKRFIFRPPPFRKP
jgi:hypothetical protein